MRLLSLLLLLSLVGACGDDLTPFDAGTPDVGTDGGPDARIEFDSGSMDAGDDASAQPLSLSTTAFEDGDPVPVPNRCGPPLADDEGMNVTPPLVWSGGPEAPSYALVVRDLSAGGLVHWAMYDIPGELRALPENISAVYSPIMVDGAFQAEIQGSGYFGYFGPCSGGRGNTYEWTLHAMPDAALPGVDRTTSEDDVASLVEERSIASSSFTGIY